MIEYRVGDILKADAEALVNTVNCVGIMGRGIALQFKKAFSENFRAYAAACKRDEVQPGRMFVFETRYLANPKYIINFPTKRHWRGKSRIEDIDVGLKALVEELRRLGVRSVAIPPLGSGLGGLHWKEVRALIEKVLLDIDDVDVTVYEPSDDPVRKAPSSDVPKMTPGRAAVIVLMYRYLEGLMDPFVSLLEVHKLMYFMQAAGEPLRLRYAKGLFGPYAENLRHVLIEMEGHLISGYMDGGDEPDKHLELVPGAKRDAKAFLMDKLDTLARFERVADLVEGFETPFGLELLSTVHWVSKTEGATTPEEAISLTYDWGSRKKQFSEHQIGLTLDRLAEKDWLNPQLQ